MNLREEMDKVAEAVAKKAAEYDTPLQEKMDALKVLTAYYAAVEKSKKKGGDEPAGGNGESFEDFTASIHGATEDTANGRKEISGRRGDA